MGMDLTPNSQEVSEIYDYVSTLLRRNVKKTRYSRKNIEEQARLIKQFLLRRGYLQAVIELEEKLFRDDHAIQLSWKIDIGKKRKFIFFGNNFFSQNQLMDRILEFGRSTWILPATFLAEELTKMYKNKGFWHVAISVQEEGERSFLLLMKVSERS